MPEFNLNQAGWPEIILNPQGNKNPEAGYWKETHGSLWCSLTLREPTHERTRAQIMYMSLALWCPTKHFGEFRRVLSSPCSFSIDVGRTTDIVRRNDQI